MAQLAVQQGLSSTPPLSGGASMPRPPAFCWSSQLRRRTMPVRLWTAGGSWQLGAAQVCFKVFGDNCVSDMVTRLCERFCAWHSVRVCVCIWAIVCVRVVTRVRVYVCVTHINMFSGMSHTLFWNACARACTRACVHIRYICESVDQHLCCSCPVSVLRNCPSAHSYT
jgi:hypothetical protein